MIQENNGSSRREREKFSRKTAMLTAAKAVFAERGYSRATLDEVAARAEFGKGTLYNYFPDGKEEILLAIFDQLYDELCDIIETSFETAGAQSFRETMKSFIFNCFEYFSERVNLFLIMVKEAERLIYSDNPERVSYFSTQQKRVVNALAAPLKQAMDRGELRDMSPEFLAHMLFVNIKGSQMRHCPRQGAEMGHPVDVSHGMLAEELADLILTGAGTPIAVAQS